jgi:hypothetical protein
MVKIIGVGLNKTGTTTLGACFKILGFRHLSMRRDLVMAWRDGRLDKIFAETDRYDSFEDWPYPLIYRELAERYTDAKFILTVRASPEIWLESISSHALRIAATGEVRKLIYGAAFPQNAPEQYLAVYDRHNREVLDFLGDRVRKLCWETGDGWSELCSFIDVPQPDMPMPWQNRAARPSFGRQLRNRAAALRERVAILGGARN